VKVPNFEGSSVFDAFGAGAVVGSSFLISTGLSVLVNEATGFLKIGTS
jgi:hypothetical protein